MLSKDLVRDATSSIESLKVSGAKAFCNKDMWIYIPEFYAERGLAYIGSEISILGIVMISTDNVNYGCTKSTAMLEISPEKTDTVNIDGEPHYRFFFPKGSVVFPDLYPKKEKGMVDKVFDTFYMRGKNPWWLTRKDYAEVLSDTVYWNDLSIHNSQVTLDVLAAQICRSKDNPRVFARHASKSPIEANKPATTVPIRNGSLNRTSRISLLANSELKKGLRSALLNEPVREEVIESLFIV